MDPTAVLLVIECSETQWINAGASLENEEVQADQGRLREHSFSLVAKDLARAVFAPRKCDLSVLLLGLLT